MSTVLANAANQEGFFRKSASIIRDIAGTNLFVDGNGRTAQAVVEALASRNNVVSGPTSAGLRSVIQQVKTGQLSSVDDIAKALRGF